MPKWINIPPPVTILDPRSDLPLAEPALEDVDGRRVQTCDEEGRPIYRPMAPWTLHNFLLRYALSSRHVPAGVKGAKLLRRLAKALRGKEGWQPIDEADVEEVKRILSGVEKDESASMDDPKKARSFDPAVLEQVVEFLECWDHLADADPSAG